MQLLTREQVSNDLMAMLKELREDWEYSGELNEQTGLFRDLGLESVDAVALGAAIEEHFGRPLPFAEFLMKAREQNMKDIPLGYLVDFMLSHLNRNVAGATA